jgi:hypothetical protein
MTFSGVFGNIGDKKNFSDGKYFRWEKNVELLLLFLPDSQVISIN